MTDASNAQTEQPQQTYQEAITRIQEIVRLLEIQFCSTRLTSIDKEVSQLLQQLDESQEQ